MRAASDIAARHPRIYEGGDRDGLRGTAGEEETGLGGAQIPRDRAVCVWWWGGGGTTGTAM